MFWKYAILGVVSIPVALGLLAYLGHSMLKKEGFDYDAFSGRKRH